MNKNMITIPDYSGENRDGQGRYKPGTSGNPEGRPKGSLSLVAILKEELGKIPEGEKEDYAHLLINKAIDKAVTDGDTSTIRDLINRIDGIPRQSIGLYGGEDNEPMIIKIINYGKDCPLGQVAEGDNTNDMA
jgi:hypothetical protein